MVRERRAVSLVGERWGRTEVAARGEKTRERWERLREERRREG